MTTSKPNESVQESTEFSMKSHSSRGRNQENAELMFISPRINGVSDIFASQGDGVYELINRAISSMK